MFAFVQVLLSDPRCGRLLQACDRYDNSPLHISAQEGFYKMVVALLDVDADVDNKNEDEQTPLHLAAREGRNK